MESTSKAQASFGNLLQKGPQLEANARIKIQLGLDRLGLAWHEICYNRNDDFGVPLVKRMA